ncbi:exodeoxyribonuclease V subunit gamma [Spirochaetota bacterium]
MYFRGRIQGGIGDKENIYLFAFSQMSRFHYELLYMLSRYYEIHLFQIALCRELYIHGEKIWDQIAQIPVNESGLLEADQEENILVRQWGGIFREGLSVFSDRMKKEKRLPISIECLFEKKKEEKRTVLHSLQNAILQDTLYGSQNGKIKQDRSLQIAACPSAFREVETVYNSIIHNMKKDPSLKLTDIAVLVVDMEKYRPFINTVFNRDTGFGSPHAYSQRPLIRYSITDSKANTESVFASGLLSGLSLAKSDLSRSDIFSFTANPCFLHAAGASRDDVSVWMEWAERLNIFHSFDAEDKIKKSAEDTDLYTWSHGLRRMRLGRIMSAGEPGRFHHFDEKIPYNDIYTDDINGIDRFISSIEKLLCFIRSIEHASISGKEWIEKITEFIKAFLSVPDSLENEEYVRSSILESISKLELLDAFHGFSEGIDVSYVIEFLKVEMSRIPAARGKYLSGGVTISSLSPMRPIPFKVIYIIGLCEGVFPGAESSSTLDLRHAKRSIGDATQEDLNKLLFLEALLSAREKLYLSYVSLDLQRDRKIHASQAVNKLIHYLNESIVEESEFRITAIPLRGDSRVYTVDREEYKYTDLMINYSASDRLACLLYGKDRIAQENITDIVKNKYKEIQLTFKKAAEEKAIEISSLDLRDLDRFIRNPIEAQLRIFFSIYDHVHAEKEESEPFASDHFMKSAFTEKLTEHYIELRDQGKDASLGALYAYFADMYSYYSYTGDTPEGVFSLLDKNTVGTHIKERIIEEGEDTVRDIMELLSQYTYYHTVSNKAIKISGIEITGEQDHVFYDGESRGLAVIVPAFYSKKKKKRKDGSEAKSRYMIKPFLFYLSLLCIAERSSDKSMQGRMNGGSFPEELLECKSITIYVLLNDGTEKYHYALDNTKEVIKYIEGLVADFLDHRSLDLLPYDIIIRNIGKLLAGTGEECARQLEELILMDMESNYPSLRLPRILSIVRPRVPHNAMEKIRKRYEYFIT